MLIKGVKNIVIGSVMEYLLRAFTSDTGAADQGYSDAQVLDTAAEGVLNSSGTVNETDGTLALSSTKLTVTAQSTPAWGDCGIVFAQRTAQQGKAFMLTVNSADYTKLFIAGWGGNGLALANVMCGFQLQTDKKIDFVSNGAVTATDLVTLTNSASASFVLIPGGYDSNSVPFDISKAIANYTYGGSLYWWNGSSWLLVWRTSAVACASKEYPLLSFYDVAGTVENTLIPDYDFSAVLQPLVLDTFTDTNGTSLADHTPDVCPVGSSWSGTGQITSNEAANNSANTQVVTIDCGVADFFIEDKTKTPSTGGYSTQIIFRYLDASNFWSFSFYQSASNNVTIMEINAGVNTVRASATVTIDISTYYNAKVICNGNVISTFLNNANKLTYTSSFLNDKTKVGIYLRGNAYANTHDNFAVWTLTSATYDSEFSKSGYNY